MRAEGVEEEPRDTRTCRGSVCQAHTAEEPRELLLEEDLSCVSWNWRILWDDLACVSDQLTIDWLRRFILDSPPRQEHDARFSSNSR